MPLLFSRWFSTTSVTGYGASSMPKPVGPKFLRIRVNKANAVLFVCSMSSIFDTNAISFIVFLKAIVRPQEQSR